MIGTLYAIQQIGPSFIKAPIPVYSLSDMQTQKSRFEADGFTVYKDASLDEFIRHNQPTSSP